MAARPPRPPRPPHAIHVKKEFRIKKETPDVEIKEYAETAMNELLGWYGYEKLNSRESQALDVQNFTRQKEEGESSDDASSTSRNTPAGTEEGVEGTCCWCNKAAPQKTFTLKTAGSVKSFCSELCFTQCRRANFKRNKTCDWCRHIRHTVNYVDFQDGQQQLQFCSDKCLNQYKMNIFCKETEAHLQLHPHLADRPASTTSTGLITPEMWMRDCRSASPESASPSPPPAKERRKFTRPAKRTRSPPRTSYPPPLLPLNGGPPRPPFFNLGFGMLRGPRPTHPSPPVAPQLPFNPPPRSLLAPITILVPQPIPIPIPLPIPLPIPIPMDMSKLPFLSKEPPGETKDEPPEDAQEPSTAPRPLRKRRRIDGKNKSLQVLQ